MAIIFLRDGRTEWTMVLNAPPPPHTHTHTHHLIGGHKNLFVTKSRFYILCKFVSETPQMLNLTILAMNLC